ncbi:MAG: peptidase M28 family protein, partial [Pseudomonadota bacterium]
PNSGSGGPDLIPLQQMGMPVARLSQNGQDVFEFHHTPNDTFDKIVAEEMAQNVAAWTLFTWLLADTELSFRAPSEN